MAYTFLTAPEPSEDEVICYCHKCGGEIYRGETYGEENGKCLCPDCIDEVFTEMPPEMKFSLMGYTPMEVRQ